jgi:arylformamidase
VSVTRYVNLSHRINEQSPGWPGNPTLTVEPYPVKTKGYSITHHTISLFNHFGTHIDGPNHFNPAGARISDLPFEFFVFEHPIVLDVAKGDGDLITPEDLDVQFHLLEHADLVLLRTGFGRFRALEPERYSHRFPGLAIAAGAYIVERLPKIRGIGIDVISIGCYSKIDEALGVHAVLARESTHGRHIVNLEDLNLDHDLHRLKRVLAMPLQIEGIDSAPAVILGELD